MNLIILAINTGPETETAISELAGRLGHRLHAVRAELPAVGEIPV
ncbi:MAG: hypothetical protein ACLFRF_04845 [Desulfobacterales bacterium]